MSEIKQLSYRVWLVPSESQEGVEYRVVYDPIRERFLCSCQGYVIHKTECKHIEAVIEMLKKEAGLSSK